MHRGVSLSSLEILMSNHGFDISCLMWHHASMRTTLNLDDDLLKEAARRAKLLRVSLGKAVSDLARRGLCASPPVKEVDGLVVFDPPVGSPSITMRKVKDALGDFP